LRLIYIALKKFESCVSATAPILYVHSPKTTYVGVIKFGVSFSPYSISKKGMMA
jgi:hypothetical protein